MVKEKEIGIFNAYIAKKGLRHSGQREIIMDIVVGSDGHLTADEIYRRARKRVSGIGQATVYRALKLLSECGLAREIRLDDGIARYEPLYGHEHHDHLICTKCGKFEEVFDEEIERLQAKLAGKNKFRVVRHKLEIYGICRACSGDK